MNSLFLPRFSLNFHLVLVGIFQKNSSTNLIIVYARKNLLSRLIKLYYINFVENEHRNIEWNWIRVRSVSFSRVTFEPKKKKKNLRTCSRWIIYLSKLFDRLKTSTKQSNLNGRLASIKSLSNSLEFLFQLTYEWRKFARTGCINTRIASMHESQIHVDRIHSYPYIVCWPFQVSSVLGNSRYPVRGWRRVKPRSWLDEIAPARAGW